MSFPFKAVMEGEKLIVGSPNWVLQDGVDAKLKLVATFMLEGRIFQGLELVGRAFEQARNRNASFSLIYLPTDNRRDAIQMGRVDWRPATPHANDHANTPSHLMGVDCDGDHYHSFDLNWSKKNSKPLKGLPIAEPIDPPFRDYTDFVDGVGKIFRISNAKTALVSPWPRDLFDV